MKTQFATYSLCGSVLFVKWTVAFVKCQRVDANWFENLVRMFVGVFMYP